MPRVINWKIIGELEDIAAEGNADEKHAAHVAIGMLNRGASLREAIMPFSDVLEEYFNKQARQDRYGKCL